MKKYQIISIIAIMDIQTEIEKLNNKYQDLSNVFNNYIELFERNSTDVMKTIKHNRN